MEELSVARDELEATVRNVMSVVLGRAFASGEKVEQAEEPSWDSLKHVELVFAIEDALGVRFDAEEMGELTSLERFVASAERHLAS